MSCNINTVFKSHAILLDFDCTKALDAFNAYEQSTYGFALLKESDIPSQRLRLCKNGFCNGRSLLGHVLIDAVIVVFIVFIL